MSSPYDPYLELLGIPADRRPPSHRDLLGAGPDETDLAKLEEAAQRRREHLKKYDIAPQEEVAAGARRLLHEVGDAMATLRRLLAQSPPKEDAKPASAGSTPPLLRLTTQMRPDTATDGRVVAAPVQPASVVPPPAAKTPFDAGRVPFPPQPPPVPPVEPIEQLRRLAEIAEGTPWRAPDASRPAGVGRRKTILRGPIRVVAIAAFIVGLAFALAPLVGGLAERLRSAPLSRSEEATQRRSDKRADGSGESRDADPNPALNGTVKIELSDVLADGEVTIDSVALDIATLKEPLSLPAGDHLLEVNSGQFEACVLPFTVRKGTEHVVRVELKRKTPPAAPLATLNATIRQLLGEAGKPAPPGPPLATTTSAPAGASQPNRPITLSPTWDIARSLGQLNLSPSEATAVERIRLEYADRILEAYKATLLSDEQKMAVVKEAQETKGKSLQSPDRFASVRTQAQQDARIALADLWNQQRAKIRGVLSDANRRAFDQIVWLRAAFFDRDANGRLVPVPPSGRAPLPAGFRGLGPSRPRPSRGFIPPLK